MNAPNLQKLMTRLTWSFIASIASFVFLVIIGGMLTGDEYKHGFGVGALELVLVLVWLCSGFGFYIFLAMLARRLNRSWIVWVGLAFITSPIGPFVAYFNMRTLVARTLAAKSTAAISGEHTK